MPDGWEAASGLDPLSGMRPSLLGWWQFREGAGTSDADVSGHGNPALFVRPETGHVSWVPCGQGDTPVGGALNFADVACTRQPGDPAGFVCVDGLSDEAFPGGFTWAA